MADQEIGYAAGAGGGGGGSASVGRVMGTLVAANLNAATNASGWHNADITDELDLFINSLTAGAAAITSTNLAALMESADDLDALKNVTTWTDYLTANPSLWDMSDFGDIGIVRAIAASNGYLEQLAGNATYMAAAAADATAMAGIAEDETRFGYVLATSNGRAAILASSTAMGVILADAGARATFFDNTTVMTAAVASSTAMTAILADATARAELYADAANMTLAAASGTAVGLIVGTAQYVTDSAGSATATTALLAAQAWRVALWGNDAALAALLSTGGAHDAARAAGTQYNVGTASTTSPINITAFPNPSGKYLLLGISWNSSSNATATLTTRRSGSARPASGPWFGAQASGFDSAAQFDVATPIEAPFTIQASSASFQPMFCRVLDCTPA